MIYQHEIVLVDRDGDALSVSGDVLEHTAGRVAATPCLTITRYIDRDELSNSNTLNTGESVSVFVTAEEMRDRLLPELVRRFFGPDARVSIIDGGEQR